MPTVVFDKVDVVFGSDPKTALELLDQGEGRDSIQDKTGNVVAVDGVSRLLDALVGDPVLAHKVRFFNDGS